MISVIDTLHALGNFPVVNADEVQCGTLRLDAVLNASAIEVSKKANKEYVDNNFAKKSEIPIVPTKLSQLQNDTGYSTFSGNYNDLSNKPNIPTKTSQLQNDSGFLTQHQSLTDYAKKTDIPTVPSKVSAFENDKGYLTQHQDISGKADQASLNATNANVSATSERVDRNTTKISDLQAQIDSLVIEAAGDSNPEVVQARTDSSGVTHETLKTRIDTEVNNLKSDIYNLRTLSGTIVITDTYNGHYIDKDDGHVSDNAEWTATGFIALNPNSIYTIDKGGLGAIYDKNKQFVSGLRISDDSVPFMFETDDDVRYVRFSCLTTRFETLKISYVPKEISNLHNDIINLRPFASKSVIGITRTGHYINVYTGELDSNVDWTSTDYIALNPNSKYTINIDGLGAVYNADKSFNYGIRPQGVTPVVINTGEEMLYMRYSANSERFAELEIKHESISGDSAHEFKPALTWTNGKYRSYDTGIIRNNDNFAYTNNIPVNPKDVIITNEEPNDHVCFFDRDGKYVSGALASCFVIPEGCYYFCISTTLSAKADFSYTVNAKEMHIKKSVLEFVRKLQFANNHSIDIYLHNGVYDLTDSSVTSLIGVGGLNLGTNLYGVGNPVIKANRSNFSSDYSPINLLGKNSSVTLKGVNIEATNCRYCIHDEMGGDAHEGNYYSHNIIDCVLTQKTTPRSDFQYPRAIGIGLGDNGHILIEGCTVSSKVPSNIDVHSGWNGQSASSLIFVKNCVSLDGTITATSGHVAGDYKNRMIVTNCLVNAPVNKVIQEFDGMELIEYNNVVINND